MAIRNVKVRNLAVFNQFEMECCDGVNVIVGENGTGKTHLLRCLYTIMNHHLWSDESKWLDGDYVPNMAYPYEALKRSHEYKSSEDNSLIGVDYYDTTLADQPDIANLELAVDFMWFKEPMKTRKKFKPHTWPPNDYKDIIFIPNKDMLLKGSFGNGKQIFKGYAL
jgi:energy-coupling factor transporter ATP-binding protein EcfA2